MNVFQRFRSLFLPNFSGIAGIFGSLWSGLSAPYLKSSKQNQLLADRKFFVGRFVGQIVGRFCHRENSALRVLRSRDEACQDHAQAWRATGAATFQCPNCEEVTAIENDE